MNNAAVDSIKMRLLKSALQRLQLGEWNTRAQLFPEDSGPLPVSVQWTRVVLQRMKERNWIGIYGERRGTVYKKLHSVNLAGLSDTEIASLMRPSRAGTVTMQHESANGELWHSEQEQEPEEVQEPAREPAQEQASTPTVEQMVAQILRLQAATVENLIHLRTRMDSLEQSTTDALEILRKLL